MRTLAVIVFSIASLTLSDLARSAEKPHQDGDSRSARFNKPKDVAIGTDGEIYVADTENHVIRKISQDGIVETVAGTPGVAGYVDGPAKDAKFNSPWCLTVAKDGTIFVSDAKNNVIRKIGPDDRKYHNGTGTEAVFGRMGGIAVAADGTAFVADGFNDAIRRIDGEGVVSTLAGPLPQ